MSDDDSALPGYKAGYLDALFDVACRLGQFTHSDVTGWVESRRINLGDMDRSTK